MLTPPPPPPPPWRVCSWIKCPRAQPRFRTQGSNPSYAKLKIEGLGRVLGVRCKNQNWQLTPDGYWSAGGDHRTRFDLGFQCKITCDYKRTYKHFMPGYMFAG